MEFKVYEYKIHDKKVGDYIGSYTLRADCPKAKELQKKYHSKIVETFKM